MHVYVCAPTWVPAAHAIHKRVCKHQELELSILGSEPPSGTGNQTSMFWETDKCSKLLCHLSISLCHLSISLICAFETFHSIAKAQICQCKDYRREPPHPDWTMWFKGFQEPSEWQSVGTPQLISLLCFRWPDNELITTLSQWHWTSREHCWVEIQTSGQWTFKFFSSFMKKTKQKKNHKEVKSTLTPYSLTVTSLWHP